MQFCCNTSLPFLNNPKDLDPSYKMDLDFLGLFWKEKKTPSYKQRNMVELTSTERLLLVLETLALVRAIGPSHCLASSIMNLWFGMRIPTSLVPGFRLGFRSTDLSSTTVTGPGRRSDNKDLGTLTLLHL